MMMLALVVLPIVGLVRLGGFDGLRAALDRASAEAASSGAPHLQGCLHLGELFAGLGGLLLFRFLFEDAGVGAGYLGQPHISTRFMSIKEPIHLRPAFLVSVLFALLVCTGAVGVGLVAHGWFRFTPAEATATETISGPAVRQFLADSEEVLPRLVVAVFPGWLAGLVVSTIMADVISSAAGYLMSAASSGVEDIYYRLLRRNASQRELLLAARAITVALGLGAGLLALSTDPADKQSAVYYLVLYAWGGLAGAFSAPVVMALYYRPMTRAGCLAGIVAGSVTSLVWHNVPALAGAAYEVIPAMCASALAIVAVSALTRPPGKASASGAGPAACP
jgi:sodium/proline symporter